MLEVQSASTPSLEQVRILFSVAHPNLQSSEPDIADHPKPASPHLPRRQDCGRRVLLETPPAGGTPRWELGDEGRAHDGPPRRTQKLARYPALPLLFDHLRDGAIIIVDDGARADEQEIMQLWQRGFGCITHEYLEMEKGAFLVCKHGARNQA